MSELVIKPRGLIKVKLGEVTYEVRKPSNKQLQVFATTAKDEANALGETIKFLAELGLPEEISWDLEPESLKEICEALMPQKKS